MKILVTGADGFIGKNLVDKLRALSCGEVLCALRNTPPEVLDEWCGECDFVFHLAGENRPKDTADFHRVNCGFTRRLCESLTRHKNICPVLYTSSTQAEQNNPYGDSKRAAEMILKEYGNAIIYRLPNVFGKWCRPNYNSVVATFCHNAARGLPLRVNNPDTMLHLVYIDDVTDEFIRAMTERTKGAVAPVYDIRLGRLAELIYEFRKNRDTKYISPMTGFEKKLYAMYTSYLPEDGFDYPTDMHTDERGSFTELFKSDDRGQVSVNIIKPGVVKGNHYHHTKNEKFAVITGSGVIRFRKIGTDKVIEYKVCGDEIRIVDIPCGYTHNIENTGAADMAVVIWCSECYDPDKPDTYYLTV